MSSRGPSPFARLLRARSRMLLLLCLPALFTHALPDDRDQPIHITADKALRDEKSGITVYSGNVRLVQGSMELEADTVTIYHTSEDAEEIIAKGLPAKMRQKPELDKEVVHAQAKVITYLRNEDRVHLQTNARIEQDGAVVDGDAIDYYIEKQLISAQSDQTEGGNKVVVVIPPNAIKKDNTTPEELAPPEATIEPTIKQSGEGLDGEAASD